MIIESQSCDLYTVMRTDMSTPNWDRVVLPYAPSDFMTAVKLAAKHQQIFDPTHARYDYRVHMVS
mgnify:CR=1 FL=1